MLHLPHTKLALPGAQFLCEARRGTWLSCSTYKHIIYVSMTDVSSFVFLPLNAYDWDTSAHPSTLLIRFRFLFRSLSIHHATRTLTWSKPTCSYSGLRWDRWHSHSDHSLSRTLRFLCVNVLSLWLTEWVIAVWAPPAPPQPGVRPGGCRSGGCRSGECSRSEVDKKQIE